MTFNLMNLPERSQKPRAKGLSMMMDKGMSNRQVEDIIDSAADLIDIAKLGFGTSCFTNKLKDKISLYKQAGIKVYLGGTLFEAFYVRGQFDDYKRLLDEYDLEFAEVSDGSMDMTHEEKCKCISTLTKQATVISEVGSKEADINYDPLEWAGMMKEELRAGSWKVIAEARESGNVGIYNAAGNVDNSLIKYIISQVDIDDIIWETPNKSQQVWFVKSFGTNINLGNIAPADLIPLETLRMGLRGDTFFQFLPENLKEHKPQSTMEITNNLIYYI